MSSIRNANLSDPVGDTGVRYLTFYSEALRRRGDVTVYLPPDPRTVAPALLILMHGVYGSHWNWAVNGRLAQTAGAMTAAGLLRPFAVAMPSDGLWGDGSGYLRHRDFDAETWIMEDVPAAVRQLAPDYPWERLYLAGLSMGGYGALRLGVKYAGRIAGISAHSAVTSLEDLRTFVQDPPREFLAAGKRDTEILYWVRQNRGQLPPIRFDCGTEDGLLQSNRALHGALEKEKVPHAYEEYPGAHEWTYWREHVRRTLRFVSDLEAATGRRMQ